MLKKYRMLVALHEAFFENDKNNKVTMGLGFAASALSIFLVVGLFQL